MNNVYILLELAKLDSEVYNLLMRASKPFNAFLNSNTGLRAIIRDSFLMRGHNESFYSYSSYSFKGKPHRLDGPAVLMTVRTTACHGVLIALGHNRTGLLQPGQTAHSWWENGKYKRTEITDHQNEPFD